jgi:hypothetical protein
MLLKDLMMAIKHFIINFKRSSGKVSPIAKSNFIAGSTNFTLKTPSSPALLPAREKGERLCLVTHEQRYDRHFSHFAIALVRVLNHGHVNEFLK